MAEDDDVNVEAVPVSNAGFFQDSSGGLSFDGLDDGVDSQGSQDLADAADNGVIPPWVYESDSDGTQDQNLVPEGAPAEEVASNAAAVNSSVSTVNSSASKLGVRVNSSKNKRIQLGFDLSAYNCIIQRIIRKNALPGNTSNLSDDEIKWLVSILVLYETGENGFNQSKRNGVDDNDARYNIDMLVFNAIPKF